MRMGLHRIPEEDEDVHISIGDLRAELLVSTQWSWLELGDRRCWVFLWFKFCEDRFDLGARCSGAKTMGSILTCNNFLSYKIIFISIIFHTR
jgi:hypothetical protein